MKNPPGMQNETRRTVEVCPKAYIQTLYFECCLEFSSGMISINPAGLVVQLLSRTPPDKSDKSHLCRWIEHPCSPFASPDSSDCITVRQLFLVVFLGPFHRLAAFLSNRKLNSKHHFRLMKWRLREDGQDLVINRTSSTETTHRNALIHFPTSWQFKTLASKRSSDRQLHFVFNQANVT